MEPVSCLVSLWVIILSVDLAESVRYVIAIAAAALALVPIVLYDRYAKRHEILTYTILRLF